MQVISVPFAAATFAACLVVAGHALAGTLALQKEYGCLQAMTDIDANTVAVAAEFKPVACTAETERAPFHYDSSRGTTVVALSLRVGAIVSSYPGYSREVIYPGETLTLIASEGAVRVEREVKALQPARSGQMLFVRGEDGTVWPARYEDLVR